MGKQLFKSLIMLGIFLAFGYTQAQKTITGTVSDADGPLPGAAVVVSGTDEGVTTDFDGNYSIEANEGDVLEFTFIGMTTATATVGGDSVINMTLASSENRLEEVVVVGYSSQTRGDITGSVASVNLDEALKVPVANAAEALQGRVTGVTVVNNGAPGAAPQITIRGLGTSNSTNPLYIIDGVQTDDPNVLNSIDPSDINQMNVLKDGAAAIYGARASNGVIIVTTKNGGYSGKATLGVDIYTGMSQTNNSLSLMNTDQHGAMIFQSLANDGADITHPQYGSGATPVTPENLLGVPVAATVKTPNGTDWQNAITQTAPTTNVTVSASNGNENGQYFMSVGYFNREGVLKYTGFERFTTRLNSEFTILERVKIGEHLNVAYSDANGGNSEAYENAFRSSPLIPTFDDAGNLAGTYAGSAGLGNARSPLAQLTRGQDDYNRSLRVFGDIYAQIDFGKGFKFKSSFGVSMNHFDGQTFTALDPEHSEPLSVNTVQQQDQRSLDWNWSNILSWDKSFGDHNINAILGIESVYSSGIGKGVSVTDFILEDPDFYWNLRNGKGTPNVYESYRNESTLFSYFLSANYNYQSKYFFSATFRNDTTSRFIGDNKSGFFPSFSAGWLMSSEDWFNNEGAVSRLKLKASWGQLGNQTLPAANPTLDIGGLDLEFANYSLNNSLSTGAKLEDVGNPDLKWEVSETWNIGIELGFLQDRLYSSIEFYQINTQDLITRDNSLISTTAIDATAPFVNLGDVKNTGVDFSIGWRDETDSGFKYSIDANLSQYTNEVTNLISDFQAGDGGFRGGAITRTSVGEPISYFYGRNVIGLSDEGRFVYEDISGPDGVPDGVINDDDRKKIGSPHPDFTYGINLTGEYKGFDLSLFFNGSQGNDIYNYNKIYTHFPTFFNGNRSTDVSNSWTPDNTNTSQPALSQSITNSETNPNSFFVEDGSFFRLKNLQIGYNFKSDVAKKMAMQSFRIYLQGTNLWTSTSYSGLDPEIRGRIDDNGNFDNLTLGVDNQLYPISSIYTIGVNLKF